MFDVVSFLVIDGAVGNDMVDHLGSVARFASLWEDPSNPGLYCRWVRTVSFSRMQASTTSSL